MHHAIFNFSFLCIVPFIFLQYQETAVLGVPIESGHGICDTRFTGSETIFAVFAKFSCISHRK